MRNLCLEVEYDGTTFRGWQRQTRLPTVQGAVETAIAELTGERVALTVAGRTDAGVHALAQVCNFRLASSPMAAHRLVTGLNRRLPPSISIHRAAHVPEAFHATRDSVAKTYRYRIYHGRAPAALDAGRSWQRRGEIDADAMQLAAAALIGEQDFESFRSAHCDAPHARRCMHSIGIVETPRPPVGRHIDIVLRADAYCRHMCRIIAGTLLEVGHGQRAPSQITEILSARDRRRAGMTAPAHGLTLLQVEYSPSPF